MSANTWTLKGQRVAGRILLFGLLLSVQACVTTYSADPIEAKVVDSETGQPLEGVVVVANWELERDQLSNTVPFGQLKVLETVTDQAGRFTFPAWGSESTAFTLNPFNLPYLDEARSPQLRFFKSDYKWRDLSNARYEDHKSSLRKSDWNGKTIELERFKGSPKEYANHLGFFNLRFIEADCNWKKVPMMVSALDAQSQLFRQHGIQSGLLTIDSLDGRSAEARSRCGSAVEFFKKRTK